MGRTHEDLTNCNGHRASPMWHRRMEIDFEGHHHRRASENGHRLQGRHRRASENGHRLEGLQTTWARGALLEVTSTWRRTCWNNCVRRLDMEWMLAGFLFFFKTEDLSFRRPLKTQETGKRGGLHRINGFAITNSF